MPPLGSTPRHGVELTRPGCEDAAAISTDAIAHSTVAMEDFLLRGRTRSPTGINALRLLRHALDCDPTHAKAWYRFGFLLHRQAKLVRAAEAALEHAARLKPSGSGPPLAELTLLTLERLIEAPTKEEEAELASAARKGHSEAMRRNPSLTVHVLKAAFGEEAAKGAFADVLAIAMEERQRRHSQQPPAQAHRAGPPTERDGEPGRQGGGARPAFPVALRSCEETRARRDVLRLQGEVEAAGAMGAVLEAELAGRELPLPPYEKPPDS